MLLAHSCPPNTVHTPLSKLILSEILGYHKDNLTPNLGISTVCHNTFNYVTLSVIPQK